MLYKKNLLLSISLLTTFSVFSQDKIDTQTLPSDYTLTNTIPSVELVKVVPPSRLSVFSSHYKSNKIVLSWKTEHENGLYGFRLERSEDGKTFEEITSERAKGNYSSGAYYEVCDKKAVAAIGYIYRLSEIDANGKISVLKTTQNIAQNKACKMSFSDYVIEKDLAINIAYKNVNEVILRILDENGKVILIDHPKEVENKLNLEWLEKGTYTVKVATSEFELQKKIIKN
jgi:Secretion system C-terminal sorting domain